MQERVVKREDIERYRRALLELGGEASLKQIAEHAGTGETDLDYIAACLIVPVPTAADSSTVFPFAIPSAWGRDADGQRLWRTEAHWTPNDLEDNVRFLGPHGGGGQRE